ncbi:MAG TPA: hypothetical protein PLI77_02670 [Bacteroidales bacterium]|nr:hypothetical protein [Bacteroidales bacterium]
MNTNEIHFKELLEKILSNKKGFFTLKYIQQRLKVGNKDLMDVLTQWIDILIEQNEIDLINVGMNKNNINIYINKSDFEQIMKDSFINANYIVDENGTFAIFTQTTKTQNPNSDMLVKKIEQLFQPLIRFDKGSRNVPIMFNLYKLFVPERLITISNDMLENISHEPTQIHQNIEVKKSILKTKKVEGQDNNPAKIILTALSYILLEKGKLILSKSEIENSRGYKIFFNAPEFSFFMNLVKNIYPFKPFVCDQFISFYPENWLDIPRLKNQIINEDPQGFIRHHFEFLTTNEVSTLVKVLNVDHADDQAEKLYVVSAEQKVKTEEDSIADKVDIENPFQEKETRQKPLEIPKMIKEKILKEKSKSENQKKKKPQTSEPLTFLNEIIYKESENNQSAEKISTKSYGDKEEENKMENEQERLIDRVHHLNKKEKHFLLLILDSTKIDSGYFSHSRKDELFNDFLKKIDLSHLFMLSDTEEQYHIKRKLPIDDRQYQTLRELIEEAILGSFNDFEESLPDIQNISYSEAVEEQNERSETPHEQAKGASLLDSFLIDELSASTTDEKEQNTNLTGETESETFEMNEKKSDSNELSDLFSIEDNEDEDVKHYFGINDDEKGFTEESNQEKNEMTGNDANQERIHTDFIAENNNLTMQPAEEEEEEGDEIKAESPSSNNELTNQLTGKIISVLTEDQEKWLKIKMLSDVIGFELRDGLAYKPEIAVFDEGFFHLEPIAKSVGATIMHIKEFYRLLGLRDKH